MTLNPLTPVTDYQSMLNRIFWFTSGAALVAVWLLRENLVAVDQLLGQIDFKLEFGHDTILPVPGSYLVPAVAVGLLSRVFRIHGQLGSWLGIRERFDIDVIIHELAIRTGIDLHDVADEELVRHRHDIMRHAFYQFVTVREPQIDEHLIHRALDLWSWLWIGLEATFVFVITSLVLIAAGAHTPGLTLLLTALLSAAVGLPLIRTECKRYAIAEVRSIVSDPSRVTAVRAALQCVTPYQPIDRRAA